MPRIIFLFCTGVCLLNTIAITAQNLPKNPTAKQVVGYRMQEQQKWNIKQLSQNSVLYKSDHRFAAWHGNVVSSKKYQPIFTLSSFTPIYALGNSYINNGPQQSFTSLQSYLSLKRMQQSQWNKQSWWRDPLQAPGSGLLRGIIIQNNRHFPFN